MNSYEKLAREVVDHAFNTGKLEGTTDERAIKLEEQLIGDFQEAEYQALLEVQRELEAQQGPDPDELRELHRDRAARRALEDAA